MISNLRIYTRKGDEGKTSLHPGMRAAKHDPKICFYGTLDEANVAIGFAALSISDPVYKEGLRAIQKDFFEIGSFFFRSPPKDKAPKEENAAIAAFFAARITWLETEIDQLEQETGSFSCFVLPCQTEEEARLQQARICVRRAERSLSRLGEKEAIPPFISSYINRLSDYLFVLGIYVIRAKRGKLHVEGVD